MVKGWETRGGEHAAPGARRRRFCAHILILVARKIPEIYRPVKIRAGDAQMRARMRLNA